MSTNLNTK